jgi:hypothetical protein
VLGVSLLAAPEAILKVMVLAAVVNEPDVDEAVSRFGTLMMKYFALPLGAVSV